LPLQDSKKREKINTKSKKREERITVLTTTTTVSTPSTSKEISFENSPSKPKTPDPSSLVKVIFTPDEIETIVTYLTNTFFRYNNLFCYVTSKSRESFPLETIERSVVLPVSICWCAESVIVFLLCFICYFLIFVCFLIIVLYYLYRANSAVCKRCNCNGVFFMLFVLFVFM
jgi:hypothetical protein